jgi:hypothetical protein
MLCIELAQKAQSRAHGADGMRAGRADADLEKLKETRIHPSLL